MITERRSRGRKNERVRKINAGWHERISKKRDGEGCRTEKRKRQRKNRELYKKNKEHKKEWGAFVIKEQMGAGDMEKMGLHKTGWVKKCVEVRMETGGGKKKTATEPHKINREGEIIQCEEQE